MKTNACDGVNFGAKLTINLPETVISKERCNSIATKFARKTEKTFPEDKLYIHKYHYPWENECYTRYLVFANLDGGFGYFSKCALLDLFKLPDSQVVEKLNKILSAELAAKHRRKKFEELLCKQEQASKLEMGNKRTVGLRGAYHQFNLEIAAKEISDGDDKILSRFHLDGKDEDIDHSLNPPVIIHPFTKEQLERAIEVAKNATD